MSDTNNFRAKRIGTTIPSGIIRSRIERLFDNNGNKWETAEGIAAKISIPPVFVKKHIERHPELYIKSPITVAGIPLYSLHSLNSHQDHGSDATMRLPQSGSEHRFRGKVIITNIPKTYNNKP